MKVQSRAPCSTFKPVWTPINLNIVPSTANENCNNAGSDIASRISIPNYYSQCDLKDTWGPFPKLYNKADVPDKCNKEEFSRSRVLTAIQTIIDQGWNYCHHHSPHWLPPSTQTGDVYTYRKLLNAGNIAQEGGDAGVCSNAFPNASVTNDKTWTGVDCSHFTSYAYNLSFGAFLNTNVGVQACDSTAQSLAVSAFLPNKRDDQSTFLPGDLLYIAKKSADTLSISHVILWTGHKLGDSDKFTKETLTKNLPDNVKANYIKAIDDSIKNNKPVYVIADSHFAGPNYRPFVSWYYTAFSHARRIIGKELVGDPAKNVPAGTTIIDNSSCTTTNRK